MIAPTPFFSDRGCHTRIYGEIMALQKRGFEVLLCTYGLGRDVPGVKTVRTFNFPWYKKLSAGPSVTKILLLPVLCITVMKTIRRFKPDIVHAHLHEGALIARFCRFFYRAPLYIFDLQGSLSREIVQHKFVKENGVLHRFFRWIERRIDRWFPIVTQSENLFHQLTDEMGVDPENMVNALDGVDTDLFSPRQPDPSLAEKIGVRLDKPRVIFTGLLEQYQGADLMFEAFRMIHIKKPDAQFLVVGYPNIEKYKAVAERDGTAGSVRFLGKVRFDELPGLLALAPVGLAPKISMSEGDGKVYNYMAMGMATVAFDRNISREILGNTGIYAKLGDAGDFADKVLFCLDNPEKAASLGKSARERAAVQLSYDCSVDKIIAFYKKMFLKIKGVPAAGL